MSIYIACSLFATMILVYWVIAELFTMLFRFTGLPDERARSFPGFLHVHVVLPR